MEDIIGKDQQDSVNISVTHNKDQSIFEQVSSLDHFIKTHIKVLVKTKKQANWKRMAHENFFQSRDFSIDHNMLPISSSQTNRGINLTRMEDKSNGVPKKAKIVLSVGESLNQTDIVVATWQLHQ